MSGANALGVSAFTFALAAALCGQQSGLRGLVKDPSGAMIPGAAIRLKPADGREIRGSSSALGAYEFRGLEPGTYSLTVSKPGFDPYRAEELEIKGSLTFDIQMSVAAQAQRVTVEASATGVGTDPSENAGAIILREKDLESFSDDPDQLAEELQALAGPGAGPNGGQIFIDGFTGGRLPSKSSIREVRINQNPYSAEFDRIGFGRIEILTKPGTDKFRGDAFFGFGDESLNSRNPFAPNKAPYQSRMPGGRVSGPLTKRSSFGFDFDARDVEENAVIHATILDERLRPALFQQAVVTPSLRMNISPRLDCQINGKNTLVVRYHDSAVRGDNRGVGGFSLLSRSYDTRDTQHAVQVSETAVLSPRAVNETRFQYRYSSLRQYGDTSLPAINVLDAFSGGGAQTGLSTGRRRNFEWQNLTTLLKDGHTLKFGLRLRRSGNEDISLANFGGAFTFAGRLAPVLDANNQPVPGASGNPALEQITSLEAYRRTLLFQGLGYAPGVNRSLGGGASQFTINGGTPLAGVTQADAGLFATWDWRARPNLTLSAGLRWEDQTNISNHNNIAPRMGLAWALDGGAGKSARTVLRWGAGMFYDRIDEGLTLSAIRFNGANQVNYIVRDPDFFPQVPSTAELMAYRGVQTVRQLAGGIRTPYLLQTSIGIERQLPAKTVVAANYMFSRGVHLLRARNINSPLAGGVRPFGDIGNVYQYESTGFSRQHQIITNFNTRFNSRVSLFGFYLYNVARSDTDGTESFPADTYDVSSEWGPSRFDVRHRFVAGGSLQLRWGLSLNPFMHASGGAPFNITTGLDNNGDTMFNDRPAIAAGAGAAGVVRTAWGNFLLHPGAGDAIIPRNYGRGPGQLTLNLRLGKTWGFGGARESQAGAGEGMHGPGRGGPGGPGGPGGGGPRGGGGGMHGPGGGPGGPGGPFGGGGSARKYNVTLSVMASNILNSVNPGSPNGNLSSALFGQSTQLAGGFGPGGGSAAGNRRIELQLRFSF